MAGRSELREVVEEDMSRLAEPKRVYEALLEYVGGASAFESLRLEPPNQPLPADFRLFDASEEKKPNLRARFEDR